MDSIVIVGAGAMGCFFAARLAERGAKLTLVDVDDDRLAALKRGGVTLTDDAGTRTVAVPAVHAAEVTDKADLVMIFTKGMHTVSAARSVSHLAHPGTFALTLQNGLGNAEAIAEVFSPANVLIGATDFPADLDDRTHVSSHGGGRVWIGYMERTGEGDEAAGAVVELFRRTDFQAVVDDDIWAVIWEKVAFNAAMNAITTVTNLPVGKINNPSGRWIASAVVREAVATAAAKGIRINFDRIMDKVEFGLVNHGGHLPSMLQDRRAGRPTEIESINGAIERAAEACGVATPVTSTLANLVRLIEQAERA